MIRKKSILVLLDKRWAKDFFQNRISSYFPHAKKLIDLKVEMLKVFLDYQRITVGYDLFIDDKKGEIKKKSIIAKAEKKAFGNKRDYLTNIFLQKQGLSHFIPRALEYYQPLKAFFYETIEGLCFKQLSIEHRANEFFYFIPKITEAVKKIHELKANLKTFTKNSSENKKYKHYLYLVKKYYPFGFQRFKNILRGCKKLKSEYKDFFSPKNNSLTHGDLHSGNIFIVSNKVKLLDFSDSSFNDPLNDLGCFFINTELMFEYDFHQDYQKMIKKVEKLFCQSYFGRPLTRSEKLRIYYYSLTNLSRIIGYVALSEGKYKKLSRANVLLEKLIKIAEKKLNKSDFEI